MPSAPEMNIMDAGLRDNFGTESAMRYLSTFRQWIQENVSEVVYIQIRDTRQYEPSKGNEQNSMSGMMLDPMFAIQQKWSAFQTYHQSYLEDYLMDCFPKEQFRKITLQYIPQDKDKSAALNFHLTGREKKDLLESVMNADNQKGFAAIAKMLNP